MKRFFSMFAVAVAVLSTVGAHASDVLGALTVPAVDTDVSDFITGIFTLGSGYLAIAVGAGVIIMIMKLIVPWLGRALRRG